MVEKRRLLTVGRLPWPRILSHNGESFVTESSSLNGCYRRFTVVAISISLQNDGIVARFFTTSFGLMRAFGNFLPSFHKPSENFSIFFSKTLKNRLTSYAIYAGVDCRDPISSPFKYLCSSRHSTLLFASFHVLIPRNVVFRLDFVHVSLV